jgi:hypothetical protein
MRIYREAGGDDAVLANVAIDLAETPESGEPRASGSRIVHLSAGRSPASAQAS